MSEQKDNKKQPTPTREARRKRSLHSSGTTDRLSHRQALQDSLDRRDQGR